MGVNLTIDVASADNQKDIFDKVAQYQEVFGHTVCPRCGSHDLVYVTREVNGNTFRELRCKSCGAKLAFGSHKQGNTLFPKKWVYWDGEKEIEVETNKKE